MVWENQTCLWKNTNQDTHLTPFMKTNLKWILELNVKQKIIKFLEENTKGNLSDFGLMTFWPNTKSIVYEKKLVRLNRWSTGDFEGRCICQNP